MPTRLGSTLRGAALAAALLVAAAPRTGSAAEGRTPNPRAATVRKVFPSAVRIRISVGGKVVRSASGIAFARRGGMSYVLTNAHVVEPDPDWRGAAVLQVLPSSGAPAVAKVVARGRVPDVDLAVVEVPGELPVTRLAPDEDLQLGDDLVVIGAPFGKGLSVAAGIVSQVEYEHAENAAAPRTPVSLKTDAAIGYGSSGGGVFDVGDGRLVGVVEGYRTARVAFGDEYHFDVPMPGETFVAPAAKIRHFLRDHGLADLAAEPGAAASPVLAAPTAPKL